jgi:hypothetical protein
MAWCTLDKGPKEFILCQTSRESISHFLLTGVQLGVMFSWLQNDSAAERDPEFPMEAWSCFYADSFFNAIKAGSYDSLKALICEGRPTFAAQREFVLHKRALHSGASLLCISILYNQFEKVGKRLIEEYGRELVAMKYEKPPVADATQASWYRRKFEGESCLHLAIAKGLGNEDLLYLLRHAPEGYTLINERATGTFFDMRCDSRTLRPLGKCAWGELALSFAVCLNLPHVVQMLVVEGGADLLAVDHENHWTALHMAVLCDTEVVASEASPGSQGGSRLEMIKLLECLWQRVLALREQERVLRLPPGTLKLSPTALRSPPVHDFCKPLACRPDRQGRTALILAASEKKICLFTALWKNSSQVEWAFSENKCAFYPLNDIEDWSDMEPSDSSSGSAEGEGMLAWLWGAGKSSSSSSSSSSASPSSPQPSPKASEEPSELVGKITPAFDLLTYDNDEAGTVMGTEPFKELLNRKWLGYAQAVFHARLLAVLANNVLFNFCTSQAMTVGMSFSQGPLLQRLLADARAARGEGWPALLLAGAAVLAFAATKAWMSLVDLAALDWRLERFFGAKGSTSLERWLSLGYCSACAVVVGSYTAGVSDAHLVPMCLYLMPVFSWLYVLWFLLGYEQHAQLVLMLWQMLFVDLYRFSALAVLIILAYATSFFMRVSAQAGQGSFSDTLQVFIDLMIDGAAYEVAGEEGGAGQGAGSWWGSLFFFLQRGLTTSFHVMAITLTSLFVAMMSDTCACRTHCARGAPPVPLHTHTPLD